MNSCLLQRTNQATFKMLIFRMEFCSPSCLGFVDPALFLHLIVPPPPPPPDVFGCRGFTLVAMNAAQCNQLVSAVNEELMESLCEWIQQ